MKNFLGLLLLLFIGLKLTNQIDWSWWLVLAPAWAPIAVILSLSAIYIIYRVFFETENQRKRREVKEALEAYAKALRLDR